MNKIIQHINHISKEELQPHNRFPITKSLKVNVVYDPKFQPKKDLHNDRLGDI